MNTHLLLLLDASEGQTPTVKANANPIHRLDTDVVMMSLCDVWQDVGSSQFAQSCRRTQTVIPANAGMQAPTFRFRQSVMDGGISRKSAAPANPANEQYAPPVSQNGNRRRSRKPVKVSRV